MGWFDFLKRKPKPAPSVDGPFTPEHFPCPDPTPGGTRHNGDYRGWFDPLPVGDEVAFAVLIPNGSSNETDLRDIGQRLQRWQSENDFARRIIGLDQLLLGKFPETPAELFSLSMPPYTEQVALVHVAPSANTVETGASLKQVLDGSSVACIMSVAYYYQMNQ